MKQKIARREVICEYDEACMTITVVNNGAKGTTRYVNQDWICTKKSLEVIIFSYIYNEALNGAIVYIDERLKSEFDALANSPYLGEFKLVYTDESGKPTKIFEPAELPKDVDTKPYHIDIILVGRNVPLFEVIVNGQNLKSKNGSITWRSKEVDEWLVRVYRARAVHPNVTGEMTLGTAGFFDTMCCNPRILKSLNFTFTRDLPITEEEYWQDEYLASVARSFSNRRR